jgi:ergothioneine biosynthesis protein EgtB
MASMPVTTTHGPDTPACRGRYREVRTTTEALCRPLQVEDYVLQAMPDVSPTRWHLAHVSWFFETFLLEPHLSDYRFFDPRYRAHVDDGIAALLGATDLGKVSDLLELGLQHEQQHQELILTDIKFNLGVNPLRPLAYPMTVPVGADAAPLEWVDVPGGIVWIGHDGDEFAFDNEGPRHRVLLEPYRMATRLVTNAEYLEFIAAGGYRDWRWWTSEGWRIAQERGWAAPLYWEREDDDWLVYTLAGALPLDPAAPVAHVSWFEADAYARWRGVRLPTEHEWEHAAAELPIAGHFQDSGVYQPLPASRVDGDLRQMFGDAWEWTQSAYAPYPGYRPVAGAIGEYNGKFMVNQMVLRGGSCATPRSHIRASYRNFFPPDARWQFSGIRLATDL